MAEKTVFVSADHGLAVFYFLQSDVVKTLLQAGVGVVVLTEDNSREVIQRRFGQPGMIVEGLREDRLLAYQREKDRRNNFYRINIFTLNEVEIKGFVYRLFKDTPSCK